MSTLQKKVKTRKDFCVGYIDPTRRDWRLGKRINETNRDASSTENKNQQTIIFQQNPMCYMLISTVTMIHICQKCCIQYVELIKVARFKVK